MSGIREGKYKKYYVQDLQYPADLLTPEFAAMYEKFSKRILRIDGELVPGACR